MAKPQSQYGAAGRAGILVPQENPTVEPELSVLLGPDIAMLVSRMTSTANSLESRLIAYGEGMAQWVAAFGNAHLDAIAFACTGTNYLMPQPDWADSATDIPVVTAAAAVGRALCALQAQRLALVSPYPDALTQAAIAYWHARGFELAGVVAPATAAGHPIYAQSGAAMAQAVARAATERSDAIVILGTGAPTLAAIAGTDVRVPVLSSNLCLAWALEALLRPDVAHDIAPWIAVDAPWRARLRLRYPSAVAGLDPAHDTKS
jgi:maleate cis-trans isomerase